jgi:hypothetical protein
MSRIQVEAYAGGRYPERPLRVLWEGAWREVAAIEHEEQREARRCFSVRLAPAAPGGRDDTSVKLCYDYANDAWTAEPLPARPPEDSTR